MSKMIVCAIIIMLLSFPAQAADLSTPVNKIIDTSWIGQQILKYGLLTSFCMAQSSTGFVESHKFNGNYIVSDSDYHIYRTVQDISWISTGWMSYANIRDAKLTKWQKGCRILGCALIARNAFEWSYKLNRWGTPFDYNPEHSNNQKALVYIKFSNGRLTDAYVSGICTSGILIDILSLTIGIWLFK